MKKSSLFHLLILFVLTFSGLTAQTLICKYCGKAIEGTYNQVDNNYFHPNHFLCAACNKPIEGNYMEANNNYYHTTCYENSIVQKCSVCGKPLVGELITYKGKDYHKKCFEDEIALRCSLCNGIISGNYLKDFWGNIYHSDHKNNHERCDYCQRFISEKLTGGGFTYDDSRTICGLCYKRSVNDITKASEILNNVKLALAAKGIRFDWEKIPVKLVNKNELQELVNEGDVTPDIRGFAHQDYKTQNDKIIERNFIIYLLSGMPYEDVQTVAVHELMHIWQYLNARQNNKPQFNEGSCEFAAFLIAADIPGDYGKYLREQISSNVDPIYGEGFRRVRKMVEAQGKTFWLETLKSSVDFPPGY
ncbi:MAG: hypothetical protein K9J16_09070 [Melioribacteraceae bacterium]|nr:hypothetical protein [Melioribacteraceae bacterium]MCF8353243.1 hypothetical protein [Melioribacteraceae bacterium]MCF8393975.1 hypothetical protein [Melioribacteraceae bacterium]MCF8418723.1 hypothetical protein [Melioribacteraceae bacterium]